MARFKYWLTGSGQATIEVSETDFRALPRNCGQFDLFLWVDVAAAMTSKRDPNREGQPKRATTRTGVVRQPDDGDLRPGSARTLLALIRAREWMTPTEAFAAGNPLAPRPTPRTAFLALTKGRQLLDVELGHERWRSFAMQRKSAATEEGCLRFEPPDIAWQVAWSEPAVERTAALPAPVQVPAAKPTAGLPVWDSERVPQKESVLGLTFIIRDALLHTGRNEAVVLLDIRDAHEQGPWQLDELAIVCGATTEREYLLADDSMYAGSRIAVPGARVERLRCQRVTLPRDVAKQWVCFAWSGVESLTTEGDEVALKVLIHVSTRTSTVTRRVPVVFRVVEG